MTTAIAERPTSAPAVTADELALVRSTVAREATDAELKLYLYDCHRQGVHPLDRLLHFTKRGGRYTPVTSIDLMRIRAADTGECLGNTDPLFTGAPKKDDFAATVVVKRLVQGQIAEFSATARWMEYFPGESSGHMWLKMPHTMLGKCAEALALRKGFPKQLAGLYAREEMDQADRTSGTVTAQPVVTQTPDGEAVNQVTGEVIADDGLLRVTRVESAPTTQGKPRWYVHLSDGRKACTFRAPLSSLAEQLCQQSAPVVVDTKEGKYGTDLEALRRFASPPPAERMPDGRPEPPPLTADDIPF